MKNIIRRSKAIRVLLFAFFSLATITILSTPVSAAGINANRDYIKDSRAGSSIVDAVMETIKTKDGGYASIVRSISDNPRAGIIKYNSAGTQEEFIDSRISGNEYPSGIAESQDGNTFFTVNRPSSNSSTKVNSIQKFTKSGNQWTVSSWSMFGNTNVIHYGDYDGEYDFELTNILLDDDGNYVVAGLMTRNAGEQLGRFFIFKISDLPTNTCSTGDRWYVDFSCNDSNIIWQFVSDETTDGIIYFWPKIEKISSGEYIFPVTDGSAYKLAKIKESSDHLSASIEWQLNIPAPLDDGHIRVKMLSADELILATDSRIGKVRKVTDVSTGDDILEKDWSVALPVGHNTTIGATRYINDFDLTSDGSVFAIYELPRSREEYSQIPTLARRGGDQVVAKISNSGDIVYTSGTSASAGYANLVAEGNSFVITSDRYIEKYTETNYYDINYAIVSDPSPDNLQPFDTQQAWAGGNVTLPKQQIDGWGFNGWYRNSDLSGSKLSNKSDSIYSDTTYYGAYTKRTYTARFSTVTYDDQGNYLYSELIEEKNVTYGDINYGIALPDLGSGYTVTGWCSDYDCTQSVDFSDPDSILNGNASSSAKNFYARIVKSTYLVNFHITSEDNPDYTLETPIRVSHGDTVARPSLSNKDGYKFNGWFTDQSLSNPYNFNAPVTSELNLYAEWIDNTLKIDEEGIHYPGNVIDGTAIYDEDTHTLTLDNYDGGPIIISGITDEVTIIVNGNNNIESVNINAINSIAPLNFEGDGTLNIEASGDYGDHWCIVHSQDNITLNTNMNITDNTTYGAGGICSDNNVIMNGGIINAEDARSTVISAGKDAILNGGQLNVSVAENSYIDIITAVDLIHVNGAEINAASSSEACESDLAYSRYFKMDKGTINTECTIYSHVFIMNDGNLNVGGIDSEVFNQNGGNLNILAYNYENSFAIESDYVVFNGGTTKIDSSFIGIFVENSGDAEDKAYYADIASTIGGVIPKDSSIEFNDGDIDAKGGLMPMVVLDFTGGATSPENIVYIGANMLTDPSNAALSSANVDGAKFIGFSDGEGDIEVNMGADGITTTHAIKAIHIYSKKIPVPATDDEDVPNTADFQILGLAGATFIAIMVQGMIIADLYRRLHGYEEEISTDNGNQNH